MCQDSHTNLFGQVEQAVFEEHVFRLAPGAVYDDHIMFHSPYFLVLHQLLQVLGFGAWIQDQRSAVPTHRSQLWVPMETKKIIYMYWRLHSQHFEITVLTRYRAYFSSLNLLPTMTLHFPCGKQAASRGTVRSTRLS